MITAGDFLAGGGGVTEAMCQIPEMQVKWVLNHDPMAIRTNLFNHKHIKHHLADIYKQDEHKIEPVDFVWASIECTQYSKANGGRNKKIGSYMLGWELVRFIKHMLPFVIGIENVPEFKYWAPLRIREDEEKSTKCYSSLMINKEGEYVFEPNEDKKGDEFKRWKTTICSLGYEYHEQILNAADFGIPTRRVRYFAFFTRKELGMEINWPEQTHNEHGSNCLKKWKTCKEFIDIENEGESIFGRKFNPNISKSHRKPLCHNTLRRIAGGLKKYAPDLYFILHYYSNGNQHQDINIPLNTITTKDRHALIKLEKIHFVADHCHQDIYNKIEEPLRPILTREEKRIITIEHNFLQDYYGRDNTAHYLNGPANTITTENSKHLISCKFMSQYYNSNGKPEHNTTSINEPLKTLTTEEKMQFVSCYLEINEKQETVRKALYNGLIDFDIKMRFLTPDELSGISTFPKGYFTNPFLRLTRKEQVKLIGNAVPPEWARQIIKPVVEELEYILNKQKVAI